MLIYSYLREGIGFESRSLFPYPGFNLGKNVVIFCNRQIVYQSITIIRKKHALVLVEGLTQGLDDATTTAESKYFFNFSKLQRTF